MSRPGIRRFVPNVLTAIRFIIAPSFATAVFENCRGLALGCLLLAGIFNVVDGALARRWGVCSEFGGIADAIAGKVMLLTLFLLLGFFEWCPQWFIAFWIASTLLQAVGLILIRSRTVLPLRASDEERVNSAVQYVFASTLILCLLFVPGDTPRPHWLVITTWYTAMSWLHLAVFLRTGFKIKLITAWR